LFLDHSNYLGCDKEIGYYVLSLLIERNENEDFPVRALLRTKKDDSRGTFLVKSSAINDLPVKDFLYNLAPEIGVKNLKKIEGKKNNKEPIKF